VCTTVVMPYSKTGTGYNIGTASKTITLDLSVWAAWAEICNRKKWSFQKALAVIGYQENDIQKTSEKMREHTEALKAIQGDKAAPKLIQKIGN